MEYLTLGFIADSFGLDGTLKIISKTYFSKQRYKKGNKIFIYNKKDDTRIEYTVSSFRSSGDIDFVKLEEINTKEEALELKNQEVQVVKKLDDLPNGFYYFSDLQGCKVIDTDNNVLGIVKEVEEFPSQITLRVKRDGKADFFVPFVKAFIINVDIELKQITINVIGGMLWKSTS